MWHRLFLLHNMFHRETMDFGLVTVPLQSHSEMSCKDLQNNMCDKLRFLIGFLKIFLKYSNYIWNLSVKPTPKCLFKKHCDIECCQTQEQCQCRVGSSVAILGLKNKTKQVYCPISMTASGKPCTRAITRLYIQTENIHYCSVQQTHQSNHMQI